MNHADAFRWISVAVSMILGLGVARLLTGAVAQFHARRHRSVDWLPLAWAGMIFVQQIGFWWSIEELATIVPSWTLGNFLVLLGLALSLFLAAALILPQSDTPQVASLRRFFDEDGRFALPVIAAYNGLAVVANALLWREPLASLDVGLNAVLVVLPLAAFAAPRPLQAGLSLGYVGVSLVAASQMLPAAY